MLGPWVRVFADAAVAEAGLGWAEQPGWQGPALSTSKALIQQEGTQGNKDSTVAKSHLKTTKQPRWEKKNVGGGWLPAALAISSLSESLWAISLKEL